MFVFLGIFSISPSTYFIYTTECTIFQRTVFLWQKLAQDQTKPEGTNNPVRPHSDRTMGESHRSFYVPGQNTKECLGSGQTCLFIVSNTTNSLRFQRRATYDFSTLPPSESNRHSIKSHFKQLLISHSAFLFSSLIREGGN